MEHQIPEVDANSCKTPFLKVQDSTGIRTIVVNQGFALQQEVICIALDAKSVVFALQQGVVYNAATIFASKQPHVSRCCKQEAQTHQFDHLLILVLKNSVEQGSKSQQF